MQHLAIQSLFSKESLKDLSEEELLSLALEVENERDGHVLERIRQRFGTPQALFQADLADFDFAEEGMRRKIRSLMAAWELGWRFLHCPWREGERFQDSAQVFHAFRTIIGREKVECVWILLLDARLRKIHALEIARGGLTQALIHPREILRHVLLRQAAGFILIHNHPSQDPRPSAEDFLITRQIAKACEIFRIDFLDHVIVTEMAYYSLADKRQM
jgi:DNA repair protein RadC